MRKMSAGELIVGEYLMQIVHEGLMWELYYENLALPAGPTYFLIKTGTLPFHAIIRLEGTGRIKVDTLKSPTITSNGTPWIPTNYNEKNQVALGALAFTGPTVSTEGTPKISKTIFGATQGNSTLSSSFNSGVERVFSENSNFLLKVTTVDTNPWFRMSFDFYEKRI